MARINIEDSLFKDSRFVELTLKLGDRHRALGAVLEAFMVAQEFYLDLTTNRMIPLKEWKKRKLCDAVMDSGLAELRDGELIYVSGSEKQFAWLIQCQSAGIQSAKTRSRATTVQRPSTTVQGPSTSYSSSYSSSSSKNINNNTCSNGVGPEEAAKKCIEGIKKFGPDEYDNLKKFVGDYINKRVIDTGGWASIREMKRDAYTLMNLTKRLT